MVVCIVVYKLIMKIKYYNTLDENKQSIKVKIIVNPVFPVVQVLGPGTHAKGKSQLVSSLYRI